MLSYVAGEKIPVFAHLILLYPASLRPVISCLLLPAFHPQCMSLIDLFFLKLCCPYPRITLLHILSSILKLTILRDTTCISILCINNGQKKKCLKDLKFSEMKDKKGPFFLTYPILLKKLGYKRVRVFLCFPLIAYFPPVLVHSYYSWFLKMVSSVSSKESSEVCIVFSVLASRDGNKPRCLNKLLFY